MICGDSMKLIDLHCDTASRIFKHRDSLAQNDYHISIDKLSQYDKYAQIMAIFISNELSDDEGFESFNAIYEYYLEQLETNSCNISQLTQGAQIQQAWNDNKHSLFLSVEDARILNGDITKLDILYQKGVRFLTLMWSGETCIGGSHNTQTGLTQFGKSVVERCFDLGIVPDVSHASERATSDMIDIAQLRGLPLIASHSNSYAVYPHTRNLRDHHFTAIKNMGGLVGISLCRWHLGDGDNINVNNVLKHIDHYLSLGGENAVSIGGDLDGTDLPEGFYDVRDVIKIADNMAQNGYTDEIINKLFWKNAKIFFENNIH